MNLFPLFLSLMFLRFIGVRVLSQLNQNYCANLENQKRACRSLNIQEEALQKAWDYEKDKQKFYTRASSLKFSFEVAFLCLGGWILLEHFSESVSQGFGFSVNGIFSGLAFYGFLGLASTLLELPFDYYHHFVVEQKHGFNKQTPKSFFIDQLKGLILGGVLGGLVLTGILWIMEHQETWWWMAWLFVSGFSLFAAFLYPSLLAPLFNKFTPLEEGVLKQKIQALSKEVQFKDDGVFVMDASKRSSHGNAYFTGLFGKKRIVLFDTLLKDLTDSEIVAVLGHELGHFKLAHVRWGMIRGLITTGVMFFCLNMVIKMEPFYDVFGLKVSNYGALLVFSSWFSFLGFLFLPIRSYISRKNEFAADKFAVDHKQGPSLIFALQKLRESNLSMPLSHPFYSFVYHSHPPILERIQVLEKTMTE